MEEEPLPGVHPREQGGVRRVERQALCGEECGVDTSCVLVNQPTSPITAAALDRPTHRPTHLQLCWLAPRPRSRPRALHFRWGRQPPDAHAGERLLRPARPLLLRPIWGIVVVVVVVLIRGVGYLF